MEFPFDHGGSDSQPSTGTNNLGKSAVATIGAGSTELTVVAIVDIKPEVGELETTVHSAEYWREHQASLKTAGQVKFTVQHDKDDAVQIYMHNLRATQNEEYFRVWLPGATKSWFIFSGIVTNTHYDTPIGDLVQATYAILPVGKIERYTA